MLAAYVDLPELSLRKLGLFSPFIVGGIGAAQVAIGETRMTFLKTTTIVPGTSRCAPQKVDPALIARFRPAMVGCFQPIFFFADHNSMMARELTTDRQRRKS